MIKYLWQLPQNLLGLLVILICKGKYMEEYYGKHIYYVNNNFFVSLGNYILLSKQWADFAEDHPSYIDSIKAHEYGHCRQSEILGPLYLIIVKIPSFILNQMSQRNGKFAMNYYNRFPENWADRLGKVGRKSL